MFVTDTPTQQRNFPRDYLFVKLLALVFIKIKQNDLQINTDDTKHFLFFTSNNTKTFF